MIDQGQWREFAQDPEVTPLHLTRSAMGILVLSYDSIFAFSANIFPNPSTALLLSKWQTTQAYANVLTWADSKFSFDSPLKPHNQATDQQNIQFLLAPRQKQSLKSVSYSKPPLPVTKCNQNHKYANPPVFRASQLLCSDRQTLEYQHSACFSPSPTGGRPGMLLLQNSHRNSI